MPIKMYSDPTGSGTFTIQSPNSNTNRTLLLPDASTTLVGTDTTQTLTNKTIQGGTLKYGTSITTNGSTSYDFTGIPSWSKRITVLFNGSSLTTGTSLAIQIGSGTIQTTGYVSRADGSGGGSTTATNAFIVTNGFSAAGLAYGSVVLTLFSGTTWINSGNVGDSTVRTNASTGAVTLSGVLDILRVTTTSGTDAFDGGSVNILFEG